MFAVTVLFRIAEERREEFMPLMLENARLSLEREPSCRRFDVCSDQERPGEVFLYELYDHAPAFEAHLQTEHFRAFSARTEPMVESKQVTTFGTVAT